MTLLNLNEKLNYIDDVLHERIDTKAVAYLTDIEGYIIRLENRNYELIQKLNEIKEYINSFHIIQKSTYENQYILKIIDKGLGGI